MHQGKIHRSWLPDARAHSIACAGLAVTILVGLGLVGFGVNGPFANLWSRVHAGWFPTT